MSRKRPRIVRILRVKLHRFSRGLDRRTPEWMKWLTPWGTSLSLHAALLLVLGLGYYVGKDDGPTATQLTTVLPTQLKDDIDAGAEADKAGDPFTTITSEEPPSIAPIIDQNAESAIAEMPPSLKLADTLQTVGAPGLEATGAGVAGLLGEAGSGAGLGVGKPGELSAPFSGRQAATRAKLVRRGGGSVHSEKAVERGLDWLARHQRPDGSWSMNLKPTCKGSGCPERKHVETDTAATGLALLPLLGAGQSHVEKGRYQKHVDDGLKWLIKNQKPNGDLFVGGAGHMYSHGIGTLTLSEAYGVTGDPTIKAAAQKAVDFIVSAQNKEDGGWRYEPGQPGDTSVFGWQMFALRSAYLAGLHVPPETIQGCRKYLDKAAVDPQKSSYAYQPGNPISLVMTSEGLLCRQYLGWTRDSPALQLGAEKVAANMLESQERNIYYWYYGTQLLHNLQGPAWQLWNLKVRDGLIATQVVNKGCDNGSWDPVKPVDDTWGKEAGRLFETSLSLLTLEVYYRYLPLYRERDKNQMKGDSAEVASEKADGAGK